jgi:RNA polymerase sigma-70 factor (ECF subfamily)
MNSSELQSNLEKYQRESFGWAMSCCRRDPLEAENVLQTVYLKILQGKARFDGKSAFKTWLFSVIRKTEADVRRRKFWLGLRLLEYSKSDEPSNRQENPDDAIYRSEVQIIFRRSLAIMSKRQRDVLQLVFYHDLSLSEAAEIMGVSIGSARTHYERGKNRLRKLMNEVRDVDEIEQRGKRDQADVPRNEGSGRTSGPDICQGLERGIIANN